MRRYWPRILFGTLVLAWLVLAAAFLAHRPVQPESPAPVPAAATLAPTTAPTTAPAAVTLGICFDPNTGSLTSAYRKGDTVLCPYGQFISVYPAKNRADADPFYGGTGP